MIEAAGLTKRFGSFTAIEDVSFDVAGGEIVGFLGPNGAGKSTTMRILAGVFPPSAGRARVAGYDVVRDSLRARSVVGYAPERIALYHDMGVAQYLTYVARMKDLEPAERRRAIDRVLSLCAIEAVRFRIIGTLSKGYRQRIGIAQALLGSPPVLILDEPTAGLDPEQVAEMRTLIRSLRGECTVILSTHILTEVEATCDRVIIIHRGKVLAVDTPKNLNQRLRRTSRVYLEVAGPPAEVADRLRAVPGVLRVEPQPAAGPDDARLLAVTDPDADRREALAAAVTDSGWGLRELRPVALTLEEIFLTLIGTEGTPPQGRPDP